MWTVSNLPKGGGGVGGGRADSTEALAGGTSYSGKPHSCLTILPGNHLGNNTQACGGLLYWETSDFL